MRIGELPRTLADELDQYLPHAVLHTVSDQVTPKGSIGTLDVMAHHPVDNTGVVSVFRSVTQELEVCAQVSMFQQTRHQYRGRERLVALDQIPEA